MSSSRRAQLNSAPFIDVEWSPTKLDKFMTLSADLRLYQVQEFDEECRRPSGSLPLSKKTYANLLNISTDITCIRCAAWYQADHYDGHLLAVGKDNGTVVLTGLGANPNNLFGQELYPKNQRHCNVVAWHPSIHMKLASAYHKAKSDHAVAIWDFGAGVTTSTTTSVSAAVSSRSDRRVIKPLFEYVPNDSCHSFAWCRHSAENFICGISDKYIKMFDMRDRAKIVSMVQTGAVYGICVDPFHPERFASYVSNQLCVWDLRKQIKPVATVTNLGKITKISWCPTKSNVIAVGSHESDSIKLIDVQSVGAGDDFEATIVTRDLQPFAGRVIRSFSWHPRDENRMILIDHQLTLSDYTLIDLMTLNWSPMSELIWTQGKRVLHRLDENDELYNKVGDIGVKMRKRSLAGYDTKPHECCRMENLFGSEDKSIQYLWDWVDYVKNSETDVESGRRFRRGFSYLLSTDSEQPSVAMDGMVSLSRDFKGSSTLKHVQYYVSKARNLILRDCQWEAISSSLSFSADQRGDASVARVAALSLFHFDLENAMRFLQRENGPASNSADEEYLNSALVALAISGYSEDKRTLWRDMCMAVRPKLNNAYLCAMFDFLLCDDVKYEDVLNSKMAIHDRVAFAARFLPDEELSSYISYLTKRLVNAGNLDGILLTGLSESGIELMQRYVDRTGDVQTAALLAMHMRITAKEAPNSSNWVEAYRGLLDQWRLWHIRAQLDCVAQLDSANRWQILVQCNFCRQSVGHAPRRNNWGVRNAGGQNLTAPSPGPNTPSAYSPVLMNNAPSSHVATNRVTCCPNCRKPLPRCALCLTNMGTPAARFKHADEIDIATESKISHFTKWFTWCQTCRHGGHAFHISQWFSVYSECPVTGCSCKCASLEVKASDHSATSAVTSSAAIMPLTARSSASS